MSSSRALVVSVDERYLNPGIVACHSAASNISGSAEVRLFVVCSDVSREGKDRMSVLRKKFDLQFIDFSRALVSGFPSRMYFGGHAVFARCFLDGILPDDVVEAVYLDADTLTVNNIDGLWGSHGIKTIGAVREMHAPFVSSPAGLRHYRQFNLKHASPYFNSGVLSIDVRAYHDRGYADRIGRLLRTDGHLFEFPDQDALNVTLEDDWQELGQDYNVTRFWQDASDDVVVGVRRPEQPRIVHFTGRRKPWNSKDVGRYRAAYIAAAREAGWQIN